MAEPAQLIATMRVTLDQFERQMKEAGVVADKAVKDIENRFEKANPRFGGTFLGTFLGNIASGLMRNFMNFIEELPEKFRAIATAAEIAGVSMERAFALAVSTGNVEATAQALERLATLLDRAKRGEENSLARLFRFNDIDVRNVRSVEEAWSRIADLARGAGSQVQFLEILRMGGIPEELAGHFKKTKEELQALAEETKKNEARFRELAAIASSFQTAWKTAIDNVRDFFLNMWRRIVDFITPLARGTADVMTSLGLPFSEVAERAAQSWERVREEINKTKIDVTKTFPGTTRLPLGGEGGGAASRDAFERTEDQLRRRIALQDAETQALGLNAEARARLRAEAELLNAAERAGLEVTDALRERVRLLAEQYAAAAARAEQARAIMEGVQQFGSAISEAFKAAVIQGQKLDEVLKNLLQRLASMATDQAFRQLFNILGGSLAGGLGGIAGGGFNPVGGFQHGGPIRANQLAMVGEAGPELFVPRTAGTIVPNNAMGGTPVSIVQTYDARGADPAAIMRLENLMAEDRRALPGRVIAAVSEAKRRSAIR